MNKTKLSLLLLAAILVGVCIGFFGNSAIIRHRIRQYSQLPANMPQHVTDRLTKRLSLDETQRQQVLAIFQKHEGRMKETREQSQAMIDSMIEEVRQEIAQHLTPAQQEEHKKALAELSQRRRDRNALIRAFPPPPVPTNNAPPK